MVWFLYTDPEAPYTQQNEYLKARNVWVHCLKNQNGPIGAIPMHLYERYFNFEVAPNGFGTDDRKIYRMEDGGAPMVDQIEMEDRPR